MFVPSRAVDVDASNDGAFAFVTYLGSSPQRVARDPRLRVVVRSRATSSYHKAVLQPPPKLKATRQGQDDDLRTSQRDLMGRFRLGTAPKAKTRAAIRQMPAIKPVVQHLPVLDPFVSSLGPSAWHLLHYCRSLPTLTDSTCTNDVPVRYSFRQKSMSISGKKDWFAFFISDKATAHATLAFISLNEDLQRGIGASATTLHHKSAAIRLARERILRKDPDGRGLDEVIGTVATLLITESLEVDRSNAEMHMSGLKLLVSLAGGVSALADNEPLLRVVGWADLSFSCTWPHEPHLPRTHYSASQRQQTDTSLNSSYTPECAIFRKAVSELIGPDLLDVFDLLHSISSQPLAEDASETERRDISTTVYSAERVLLEHQSRIQSVAGQPSWGRIFSYAAMTYITVALRDFPLEAPRLVQVVRWLDGELTSLIRKRPVDEMGQAELVLTLWMRMVQLIATPKERLSPHLVPSLRSISKALGIDSVASLASTLRQVVWSDGLSTCCVGRLFSESAS